MSSLVLNLYIFDPISKTIDLIDPSVKLEGIKLITNVTAGIVIYQFNDPANNGLLAGTILTLDYNTVTMSPSDRLMIIYDAPTSIMTGPVTGIQLVQQQVDVLTDADQIALRYADYSNTEVMSRAISGASIPGGGGGTAIRVAQDSVTVRFSTQNIQPVAHQDCSNYAWMVFQVSLVGTSTAFQPQFSNDGQTWVTSLYYATNVTTAPIATASTAVGMYCCPILGKFARLNITGTTAGRCEGVVQYDADAPPAINTNVNAIVTGTISGLKTNNAAVPAATNLGVLSAVANAVSPTYTETFQTALSVDLAGALRTGLTTNVPQNQTDGRANPLSLNQQGELRIDINGQRRLQEQQIVQSLEEDMRVLQSGEQYGGGNYGFEVR